MRDNRGRFTQGNGYASQGGRARARSLSPTRRKEIAALGWAALVERRFGGDIAAAREWIGRVGFHTYARAALAGTPNAHKLNYPQYAHPGSPEEFLEYWERRLAFNLEELEAQPY